MSAREKIEGLSVASVLSVDGPKHLAAVGDALFVLAQRTDSRERYELAKVTDLETRKPLVVWSRSLSDGPHTLTLSPWADNSYVLYDVLNPAEEMRVPGYLRAYMFGADRAVSGLAKAMQLKRLHSLEEVPEKSELEERVGTYARHPTRARYITSADGAGAFVRLVKSSIERP